MRLTHVIAALAGGVAVILSLAASPAQAEELWINMVAATSADEAPPMGLFAKQPWSIAGMLFKSGKWQADKEATFVKLHLYADREFELNGIVVKTCGDKFSDYVQAFINFDKGHVTFEQAKGQDEARWENKSDKAAYLARSITFNFGLNKTVCIRSIDLLDTRLQPYSIRVPRVVAGSAKASSTTKPTSAYDVMNLFDSRYENSWASDAKSVGETLDFTFEETQTVTMLKVWNGYQRSDEHCYENVRVKTWEVTGDGGYQATVAVQDVMGSQDVPLPKPFSGKHMRLTVKQAYPGKTYKDLVVTELRFFDGKEWFTLDPFPRIREIAAKNRAAFAKAGLSEGLDATFNGGLRKAALESPTSPGGRTLDDVNQYLVFRFRSDGSFYFESNDRDGDPQVSGTDRFRNALGNYEVREATAEHLDLRVFGLYRFREAADHSGDCNGCGRDCSKTAVQRIAVTRDGVGEDDKPTTEYETHQEQIFQENLRLIRTKDAKGRPAVKVESLAKKRFLLPRPARTKAGNTLLLAAASCDGFECGDVDGQ